MKQRAIVTTLSILLTTSLLGLIALSKPASATPTIIHVPSNYPTIQDAINNANPGDTILVAAGTYRENVVINQTIALKGSGQNVTVIKGEAQSKAVVDIKINNINISGFTIQGGSSGISIVGYNSGRISDNKIILNSEEGILLLSSHNNVIFSNVISLNGFEGIYLESSSNNLIYDNVVTNDADAGIDLYQTNNNKISNNTIAFNKRGIWLDYSNGSTFEGNTVSNNTDGVSIGDCYNNVFYHNNFINNTNQVDTLFAVNSWNTTAEGNYWSDYIGPDGNGDGIGDTWYEIDAETNQYDYFPLMSPRSLPKDVAPPITTDDYDDLWHTKDFSINLKAVDDLSGVKETYYRINDGQINNLSADGQPRITTEGANNKLDYWSVDKVGYEEFPHKILTGIKLDKTAPIVLITSPSLGYKISSPNITATWNGSDATSGISHYEIMLDDGSWTNMGTNTTHTFTGVSDGAHKINVKATDTAGNAKQDTADFTVSVNPSFGSNSLKQAAIAAAIIILAFGIALYFLKIRKR